MTNIFVHLGDLHLRPDARNPARWAAVDQAINEWVDLKDTNEKKRSLRAWLWPGDLNHASMAINDRNGLVDRLQRMSQVAPVVICYGNHDKPGDLDVFRQLNTKHPVYVVGGEPTALALPYAPTVEPYPMPIPLLVLPYPTKAAFLAAGMSGYDLLVKGQAMLTDAIDDWQRDYASRAAERRTPALVIGHLNVSGALSSAGQPQIGRELELDKQALECLPENVYVGLNHIHKAQVVGRAHYAGSMCRLDWGEIEDKSYTVVTYEDHKLVSVDRHPLNVPKMYHLDGSGNAEGGFTFGSVGLNHLPPSRQPGYDIRVRYTFPSTAATYLPVWDEHIRDNFRDASRIVIEPIAVGAEDGRAPAVAAASTLVEKLDAWSLETQGRPLTVEESVKADALLTDTVSELLEETA